MFFVNFTHAICGFANLLHFSKQLFGTRFVDVASDTAQDNDIHQIAMLKQS